MSSLNPPYTTYIYLHRQPLTWEWLNDLLCKLWMRGITFSRDLPAMNWEEELRATSFGLQGSSSLTLGEALKENIARGFLYLTFWDNDLEYKINIDPNGDEEREEMNRYQDDPDRDWLAEQEEECKKRETVGRITLYCDMSRHDRLYGEKLTQVKVMPYLSAYHGHLHWSKILCEILNPLFALGDAQSELAEDEHLQVWELIARGEVPDVVYYLQSKAFCYLPSKEGTIKQITQALDIPHCSVQRLLNRGTFFSVTHPPFYYEDSEAQRLFLLGEDVLSLEQAEERPLTDEVIKERMEYFQQVLEQADLDKIMRYFQRALMIYSTIQDVSSARKVESRIRWLEGLIEEKLQ